MNTYEQNYWSLYLDFIDSFKELNYDGYSLPYLCHFLSLIRKNGKGLMNQLYDKSFSTSLTNKVESSKDIQTKFDRFMKLHTNKELRANKNGKVIIHDVYNLIRFPSQILKKHFDPLNTIILKERKHQTIKNPNTNVKNKSAVEPRNSSRKKSKNVMKTESGRGNYRVKEKRDQSGIPIHYFDRYSKNNKKINQAIKQNQIKAKEIINSFHKHPLFNDVKFQKLLMLQISKIIHRIEESRTLFRGVLTSCIILASTHYPESRTLALIAAEKGIPTICMQHGIISSEFGYLPKIALVDAVYGNFEATWYKEKGVSEDSIEIIGHPRFDQIFTKSNVSRKDFDKKLGLNPGKRTVLIIVRGEKDIEKWRVFIQTLSNKNMVNIIIKDFPNLTPHKLTKEFLNVSSTKDFHLYDILHNIDAVVAYSSTVGLESMLANQPTFILNDEFPGYTGYYYLLNELCEDNPRRLANRVAKYFEGKDMEEYVKQTIEEFLFYAYPDMSMSGERLMQLINRLTTKNTSL